MDQNENKKLQFLRTTRDRHSRDLRGAENQQGTQDVYGQQGAQGAYGQPDVGSE